MVGRPPPGSQRAALAQMVASVGPYRLKKLRPGAHASTSASGHASPATISVRSTGSSPGGSAATVDGVSVAAVTSCSRSHASISSPGSSPPRGLR
jgi:hypothetical protein